MKQQKKMKIKAFAFMATQQCPISLIVLHAQCMTGCSNSNFAGPSPSPPPPQNR